MKWPQKYKWISFETAPSEVGDDPFFLDDILLLTEKDKYHMFQMKYRQSPANDPWTWDELLKKEKSKRNDTFKDSLLEKWSKSVLREDLKEKIEEAHFVTNGTCDAQLSDCLDGDLVDLDCVQKKYPETYNLILAQFKNKAHAKQFFKIFSFKFSSFDHEELFARGSQALYNYLDATEEGVFALLLELKKHIRQQFTLPLTALQLQSWCRFDKPRPLNQSFHVPKDFQIFSEQSHISLIEDLRDSNKNGFKVIFGKPGAGKSTYLSALVRQLESEQFVCIRHHYHLDHNDPEAHERLNFQRATDAIKAQFKKYPKVIGPLARKQSRTTALSDYIRQAAEYSKSKGKNVVLVIDGLDHVPRYANESDLADLLNSIAVQFPGLWIIFGMQIVAEKYLPQSVLDSLPKTKWIEVTGLNENAVEEIIAANVTSLELPKTQDTYEEFVSAAYDLSKGNPLHLRYTLHQLKNQNPSRQVSSQSCEEIIPYDQEISKYYDALWRKLPDNSKTALLALSLVSFKYKEIEFRDFLGSIFTNPADISTALQSVYHLLIRRRFGLNVFHNSFALFISSTSEFSEQRITVLRRIKDWLERSEFQFLKWSELRILNYYLGDPSGLLALDKDWIADAIVNAYPIVNIVNQLQIGVKAAIEFKEYPHASRLSIFRIYVLNSVQFNEVVTDNFWKMAIHQGRLETDRIDFRSLSISQIVDLAHHFEQIGDLKSISQLFHRLNSKKWKARFHKKGEIGAHLPLQPKATTKVAALIRDISEERVLKYTRQYSDSGWAEQLTETYLEALLNSNQFVKSQKLLKHLDAKEVERLSPYLSIYSLKNRTNNFDEFILEDSQSPIPTVCLYRLLLIKEVSNLPPLPPYDAFPTNVQEHDTGNRYGRIALFYNTFVTAITWGLSERTKEIEIWKSNILQPPRWGLKAGSTLMDIGLYVATSIKNKKAISFAKVFEILSNLELLKWIKNRDIFELQLSFKHSLPEIFDLIFALNRFQNKEQGLNSEDFKSLFKPELWSSLDTIKFLEEISVPIVEKNEISNFIDLQLEETRTSKQYFSDRTSDYLSLARLSHIYGDGVRVKVALKRAAQNFIAYGNHKDMLLDEVMSAIKSFTVIDSKFSFESLVKISPFIESVSDYTDNDETSSFKRTFAKYLSEISREHAIGYYLYKIRHEQYWLADDVFADLLKSFDPKVRTEFLIATTAVEKDSRNSISVLADLNPDFKLVKDALDHRFGSTIYLEDRGSPPDFKEPVEDYLSVLPDQLVAKMIEFDLPWDKSRYLTKWRKDWIDSKKASIEEIMNALCTITFDIIGLDSSEAETLDLLAEYLVTIDSSKAFDALCWAQTNGHSWDSYWDREKRNEVRWQFIKDSFPNRWEEFFKRTTINKYDSSPYETVHVMPTRRAIDFFIFFEKPEIAKALAEELLKISSDLMADYEFGPLEWTKSPQSLFDLIIGRLSHPNPCVRERVASACAEILASESFKGKFTDQYIEYIKGLDLESQILISLIPIEKSFEIGGNADLLFLDRVLSVVKWSSGPIEYFIFRWSRRHGWTPKREPEKRLTKISTEAEISDFFTDYSRAYLQPYYYDQGEIIAKNSGMDFLADWFFSFENEKSKFDHLIDVNESSSYAGDRHYSGQIPGFNSLLSEIFRSTFWITLESYFQSNVIDSSYYRRLALKAFPIDFSFWKKLPEKRPNWWPALKSNLPDLNLKALDLNEIESIFSKDIFNGESRIIAFNGSLDISVGGKIIENMVRIECLSFGYKTNGTILPNAEEVWKAARSFQTAINPGFPDQLNFYGNQEAQYQLCEDNLIVRDLAIVPLVCRPSLPIIDLWQWWRIMDYPFVLSNLLEQGLSLNFAQGSWKYLRNEQPIAQPKEWAGGIQDRNNDNKLIPYGTWMEFDEKSMEAFLNKQNLRLGKVIRITVLSKPEKYKDDVVREKITRLFGVSNIII